MEAFIGGTVPTYLRATVTIVVLVSRRKAHAGRLSLYVSDPRLRVYTCECELRSLLLHM